MEREKLQAMAVADKNVRNALSKNNGSFSFYS
jgi:hypothetical protein